MTKSSLSIWNYVRSKCQIAVKFWINLYGFPRKQDLIYLSLLSFKAVNESWKFRQFIKNWLDLRLSLNLRLVSTYLRKFCVSIQLFDFITYTAKGGCLLHCTPGSRLLTAFILSCEWKLENVVNYISNRLNRRRSLHLLTYANSA